MFKILKIGLSVDFFSLRESFSPFTLPHCFILYSLLTFSNPDPQSEPPQCPLAPLAGYLLEPCTLTRLSWPGQSPLSCSAASHWRGCWLRVSLGGCSSSPRCRPCLQRSITQKRQFFEISEWRSHIFPVAFLDESDIGSTGCASASGRQHAFFFFLVFGGLWGWKIAPLPVRMLIIGAGWGSQTRQSRRSVAGTTQLLMVVCTNRL